MEQGNAAQFKNKCLEEIEIDMENVEEDSGLNTCGADVAEREFDSKNMSSCSNKLFVTNTSSCLDTDTTDCIQNNGAASQSADSTENIYSNTGDIHESESSDNGKS